MIYQNTFQAEEQPSRSHVSCYTYSSDKNGCYPPHCHAYYEISYIAKGSRYEFYNGTYYEVEDHSLFFIPPLHIHSIRNITQIEDLIIQFSPDFLSNTSQQFYRGRVVTLKEDLLPYLSLQCSQKEIEILNEIAQLCRERDTLKADHPDTETAASTFSASLLQIEWKMSSLVLSLLANLLDSDVLEINTFSTSPAEIASLELVINRILTHPEQKLDMQSASRMAGMSYYHFSRTFKSATGFLYSDYCNILRIRYSEDLLINTSLSVAEVAAAIGIDTASYFTRLFKKVNGISPIAYRRNYQYKAKAERPNKDG